MYEISLFLWFKWNCVAIRFDSSTLHKGAFTLANFARAFALSLHVLQNKNYLFSLLNVQASVKLRAKSCQCKCTLRYQHHSKVFWKVTAKKIKMSHFKIDVYGMMLWYLWSDLEINDKEEKDKFCNLLFRSWCMKLKKANIPLFSLTIM